MAKTNAERQKEFHQKMLGEGNVKVVVYAPKDRASDIRVIAANMRNIANKPSLISSLQRTLIEAKGALSCSVRPCFAQDQPSVSVGEALVPASATLPRIHRILWFSQLIREGLRENGV